MKAYEKNHNPPIDEELHGWRSGTGKSLHVWQLIIIVTQPCLIVGRGGRIIQGGEKFFLKFLRWDQNKITLRLEI